MRKITISLFLLLFLLLFLILLSPVSLAQVPSSINYQGVLKYSSGELVSGEVNMTFQIYDGPDAGAKSLWDETKLVTLEAGLYSVLLGSQTDPITPEVFSGVPRYLGVTIAGEPEEMKPRIQLVTVPYAFRSEITNSLSPTALQQVATHAATVPDPLDVNPPFGDGVQDIWGGLAVLSWENGITGTTLSVSADAYAVGGFSTSKSGIGVLGIGNRGIIGFDNEFKNEFQTYDHTGTYGVLGGIPLSDIPWIAGTYKYGVYGQADVNNFGILGYYDHPAPDLGIYPLKQAGVYGRSIDGPGVWGISENGSGIRGFSKNGHGVYGTTEASGRAGVYGKGEGDESFGVVGVSDKYYAVAGFSSTTEGVGIELLNNVGVYGQGFYGVQGWCPGGGYSGYFTGGLGLFADKRLGGSIDLAENIPTDENFLEAGDVVVIDLNNMNKIKRSEKAYDTTVAGIISTNPDYLMGANIKDGRPVALAGRVPTKVCAENGPIKVGDLLTTSNTPGYAMKVTDKLAAVGAIVGKAMEPLASGRGKIMVLVTLQ